jgi:phage shock protein A
MSPFWRGNQLVWTQKKELEMRADDLENQYAKLGSKARSNLTQGEIQKSLSKSTLAVKLRKPSILVIN